MKKCSFVFLFLLLAGFKAVAAERDSILLNFDWRFHLGEVAGGEKPENSTFLTIIS